MLGGGADADAADDSGGEADIGSTIKDLEFRLSNDLSKVQNQDNKVHSFTLKQINILKAILCSGLYPQVLILLSSISKRKEVRCDCFYIAILSDTCLGCNSR